jgi:predicted RNase H-like HicB family nuclease
VKANKNGSLKLILPVERQFKKRTRLWVLGISALDLWAQGATVHEARQHLDEVVSLFFEDCLEAGTLFDVLQDCGFELGSPQPAVLHKKQEPDTPFGITLPLLATGRRRELCHA